VVAAILGENPLEEVVKFWQFFSTAAVVRFSAFSHVAPIPVTIQSCDS
jgi:hypothetical protein